jgi:hypothetical protein
MSQPDLKRTICILSKIDKFISIRKRVPFSDSELEHVIDANPRYAEAFFNVFLKDGYLQLINPERDFKGNYKLTEKTYILLKDNGVEVSRVAPKTCNEFNLNLVKNNLKKLNSALNTLSEINITELPTDVSSSITNTISTLTSDAEILDNYVIDATELSCKITTRE